MTIQNPRSGEPTIADYFTVVRRYKWLVILGAIVVPIAAFLVSTQQQKVYEATSEVLLSSQELGSELTGLPTVNNVIEPDRHARTQAALARVPAVVESATRRAGVGIGTRDLIESSSVSPREDTDLLVFAVRNNSARVAQILATAYANAFTAYKLKMDTASLSNARLELQARLAELRRTGGENSEAYRELVRKSQDLRTLELLQVPAAVVRVPTDADQIAPQPMRNAVLGVLIGLVLGIGGAFLLNALDRKVRDADELEHELQIPLLARLPTPHRNDPATVLARSTDETTEAIARLRANFDFVNSELRAKVIMVTSATPREGKSTTIANLAIALARTGRHVVLVDLDLRRPSLNRLLHMPDGPGVTDLASGNAELAETIQPVGVATSRLHIAALGRTESSGQGRLEVVSPGRSRVEPSDFVETAGLTEALQALRSHAEIVLVDAPPVLATGDAIALTGKVDAVLLVSRLGALTRPTLQELSRTMRRSPAPVLGLIATGAELDEGYSYSALATDYYATRSRAQRETPQGAPVDVSPVQPASAAASGRWTPRGSR
jgi:capsular exopolysaccharide synthesis family protein